MSTDPQKTINEFLENSGTMVSREDLLVELMKLAPQRQDSLNQLMDQCLYQHNATQLKDIKFYQGLKKSKLRPKQLHPLINWSLEYIRNNIKYFSKEKEALITQLSRALQSPSNKPVFNRIPNAANEKIDAPSPPSSPSHP